MHLEKFVELRCQILVWKSEEESLIIELKFDEQEKNWPSREWETNDYNQ